MPDMASLQRYLEKQRIDNAFVITYLCCQQEQCPETGHLHYQGYFQLAKNTKTTYNKIQKQFAFLQGAHFKNANGSDQQNYEYCSKKDTAIPNTFFEFGHRRTFDESKFTKGNQENKYCGMKQDVHDGMSLIDFIEKYSWTCSKNGAKLESVSNLRAYYDLYKPSLEYSILKDYGSFLLYQKRLIDLIEQKPDNRKIIWVYDPLGNKGKTVLCKHLCCNNNFLRLTNGKTNDISYVWKGQHIVFDFSRSQEEVINYGVLEDLKNGMITSYKYESCVKHYEVPHVLVMSNFLPNVKKMSLDRWLIYQINDLYDIIDVTNKHVY